MLPVALGVAKWMLATAWPRGQGCPRDQGVRAATSVVLNVAEGRSRGGKPGRNHHAIALGSAGEVAAILDLVDKPGIREQRQAIRRVGAMLHKMAL